MVVLYDYQNRRFQYRVPFPDEELNEIVTKVETAINDMKTKLAAAIARHRIKASARSLEFLLPESVRHSDEAKSKMPAYFWINQLRTSTEDVMDLLRVEGFKIVNSVRELGDDGDKFYCFDHHCPDLLVVASHQVKSLQESDIVNDGLIVRQDKSSCLAPHTVKYLLNEDDDVIHVNAGFGLTSGHIASLLKPSKSHIFAFGATGDADVYRIHKNLGRLGVGKCVRVISEPFLNIEPDDSRYKSVRIVLVTADCTKSAVTNPVEFVVSEGEDMTILKDLSVGDKDAMKINQLNNEHSRILKHAMRFSKVQAVVYMTRSVHEAENEMVVEKTVEYVNSIQQKKMPFRLVPPVLAFSADEIENNRGICGKYMKFKPSNTMNGCFVAVITREPEDLKDSAKDAIARANAKGLLGAKSKKGHDSDNHHGHHIKSKKSRKKLRASASAGFKPNMTISSNRMQMYQKSSGLKQVISAARKRDQDDKTKHLSLPRLWCRKWI
ncbi:hypothetical protein LOTGIDRAFT_234325 [Lottia gigantea]|uniref:SAM-dependent MTase RsmB/NOP-type domain-containing protein n=1 Tax=Lottia gigantea TaxID=225164 RepID=V3ZYP7_LOTGI|nr:hypothetical protein LOTGIDRAFT_234325 [Lottia gigantea]ESO89512.1 hypothetical protein LOTGIDRAFT_234325 [Lottia gigantea]